MKKYNLKSFLLYFVIFLLSIGIAFSQSDEEIFKEAKQLIDAKTPCSQLTEDQLEHMGDYYMEQMHPGEAHEIMDKMMGGEGSESLRQVHIAMANSIYCNESGRMMGGGMMNMMMGGNMMGSGGVNMMGTNMGYGMMGNYGYGYWGFLNVLSLILVIGLIILVYLWIIKLWREMPKKK